MSQNTTALNRALSKLGLLSRSEAAKAILAGRVRVDGKVVLRPAALVTPERARIEIDGEPKTRANWRTLVFHKPRGVVTTRTDPNGRPTVYDTLGEAGQGLIPVGRLDLATSGLLVMTSDTQLGNWIADPANEVPRSYIVTVRGRVDPAIIPGFGGAVVLRKASGRESHLTVELREGKNREVRRMFAALGHEVTRLKRIAFGGLSLGDLQPGAWRELTRVEVLHAFPGAPVRPAARQTV